MKGGVTFFRSVAAAAVRTYFFSPEAVNSGYYLESTAEGHAERMTWTAEAGLDTGEIDADEYSAWVDFTDPETGESRGRVRKNSVRFMEKNINLDKSLSLAAAVNPQVAAAVNQAQRRMAEEMTAYAGQHFVTRVGPAGGQRQVSVEQLEVVIHAHAVSRENEPHPHLHWQVGSRVYAEGGWRQLDTADAAKHSAALNALGENVLHADPQLRRVLAAEGYSFDPATGKVAELEAYVDAFSTRAAQIRGNKKLLEQNWRADPVNVGKTPGPRLRSEWDHMAWNGTAELEHIEAELTPRPQKTELAEAGVSQRWAAELEAMGFTAPEANTASTIQAGMVGSVGAAAPDREELAAVTLAKLAGTRSAWSSADIRAEATRQLTASGYVAEPEELAVMREQLVGAIEGQCRSISDPRTRPGETARHWTSTAVIEAEDEIKNSLAARAAVPTDEQKIEAGIAAAKETDPQLSDAQARAAALLAAGSQVSAGGRLVVIEGAAGAGKTKVTGAAQALRGQRPMLTVTPTKKAAQEARHAGADACSLHKLLHAHGFRWDEHNQWTRLAYADLAYAETDPVTGRGFSPPRPGDAFYLQPGTQLVVDEAGMIDQEAARALLRLADHHGADVALIGDRAQLAAVGRGGVLDMAARVTTEHVDLDEVHRFQDPDYAQLSLNLRDRHQIPETFDALVARGDVQIHPSTETAREALAREASADIQAQRKIALTVPTNEAATRLNETIQAERIATGAINPTGATVRGSDELSIYPGDTVMTRSNNRELGVANRESFQVVSVHSDGALKVASTEDQRHQLLDAAYVAEHVHLGYAVTDYGNQGTTVDHGSVLVEEGMSGAGAYVGATRGRETNTVHIVAEDPDEARAKFTRIMGTDRADRGLDAARVELAEATKGLDLHPVPPQPEGFPQWAQSAYEETQKAAAEVARHRDAHEWPKREADFRQKYGTDLGDVQMRYTQAQHQAETTQKAVEETANRIIGENQAQITRPLAAEVEKLRTAETDAREAGFFTRGSKTRGAHQLRGQVEGRLGVKLPGEDRIHQRPPQREDMSVLGPMIRHRLSETVNDHPDYQAAVAQAEQAQIAQDQAKEQVQNITALHREEVGPRPRQYHHRKHLAAEDRYRTLTSHGLGPTQLRGADPQQQADLAEWKTTVHEPYKEEARAQAQAAAQPPRRTRSVEEQLADIDPYHHTRPQIGGPGLPGFGHGGPGHGGPDLGR